MKTLVKALLLIFPSLVLNAQENMEARIPLIGELVPQFTAESTQGKISFPDDYYMKWKILFSHPADFTPICSTEILELAAIQDDFEKLDTKLIVMSTDGIESHLEWVRSLEATKYKGREPVRIKFPLISDKNLVISKKYGMIHSYSSSTKDVRGVFIIDQENKLRAMFFYPFNVGRNIDEIKRTLIALQTAEKKNILIPADWNPGDDVVIPSPKTVSESEKLAGKNDPDLYQVTWFLWFRKMK